MVRYLERTNGIFYTFVIQISVWTTCLGIDMTVELIAPVALENGTKFSIREGGRTVGAGVVSEIIE